MKRLFEQLADKGGAGAAGAGGKIDAREFERLVELFQVRAGGGMGFIHCFVYRFMFLYLFCNALFYLLCNALF